MSAPAWYCVLCGAPARPGSIQPAAADGYATGVCSGEHQYAAPDKSVRLAAAPGEKIPNQRQRRVGMVLLAAPPQRQADASRARGVAAPSLWGDR